MSNYLKRMILFSIGLIAICLIAMSAAPALAMENTEIRLGVYNFPPVATVGHEKEAGGLLGDVLDELQREHPYLSFQIVHTSPKRRHMDFRSGLYDVMFFEDPGWGWASEAVETSKPVLKDEDIYVALNKTNRDQSFFDRVGERRIAAIAGYHYGFASLETDSDQLREKFDIEFSHSHQRNIDLIKADRPSLAEVAVVSRSFLHTYFSRFPDQQSNFLVSDKVDQSYDLPVITRKGGPISLETIEGLLRPLIENGRYLELVRKHGLQLPESMLRTP